MKTIDRNNPKEVAQALREACAYLENEVENREWRGYDDAPVESWSAGDARVLLLELARETIVRLETVRNPVVAVIAPEFVEARCECGHLESDHEDGERFCWICGGVACGRFSR